MSRTVVHLLRHGKVHNPDQILYGRLDGYHLSASGRKMADGVAEHLAHHDIVHLVASPLTRAQETAAPLAAIRDLEIDTDPRVIEAGNQFEGLRIGTAGGELKHPKHWPLLRNPFTPSWGEPYLDIAYRMMGAVHDALVQADGHEAVIVSHQLPIWTARRFFEGKRLWHNPAFRECALASLTSLTFEDGVFTGLDYSEPVAHIKPENDGVESGA